MGKSRDRKFTFRLTQEEYEFLLERFKQEDVSGKNYKTLSDFIRESTLEKNGYHGRMIKEQLYDLKYEIRKIGVNINQVTKKINGGFGTTKDVEILESSLLGIENYLKVYEERLTALWQ